ncbi:MAG: DUF5658 family protein [Candidatus Glassbacteria bacterium]
MQKWPSLKYLLKGRRRRPRRAQDWKPGFYVDVYGTKIFIASFFLIFLSIMDALLTLHQVERGAREINPTMNFLLKLGLNEFFYVKYAITCLGVLFLCIHKNFPFVKEIILILIIAYMLVISWHLYLLSVY